MASPTLHRQGSPLANSGHQLEILSQPPSTGAVASFAQVLSQHGYDQLNATGIAVLQINLGKLCNQTCRHCHVDAGPDRREIMDERTATAWLDVLAATDIPVVDITGGAPEMNPQFRRIVARARELGRHVIDRCNLTILLAPGYNDLPEFLAAHRVEVIASLPCYLEQNTDAQRGDGVFAKSIAALRRLNELGYGRESSGLALNLVYNPVGPSLPPPQADLEAAYRRELRQRYAIEFNRLYTITNMPISRFLDDLLTSGRYEKYMQTLLDAFNPATVTGLMCRTMLSVDWQGRLYDCDFNQMLEIPVAADRPRTVFDFDAQRLATRPIITGPHCFGCTAGAGSSCQGVVAPS